MRRTGREDAVGGASGPKAQDEQESQGVSEVCTVWGEKNVKRRLGVDKQVEETMRSLVSHTQEPRFLPKVTGSTWKI